MKKFNLGNYTQEDIKRVYSDSVKLRKLDNRLGVYGNFYSMNLLYGGIGKKEEYELFEDYDDLYVIDKQTFYDDLLFERGDIFCMTLDEYKQMKNVYSGEEKKINIFNFNTNKNEDLSLIEVLNLIHTGKLMEKIDVNYRRDEKLQESFSRKKWEKAFSK